MKTSELMLGDWVLDTRTKNPLRVNPFMAEMEVPEWEPIPITKELLEKNGFECTEKHYSQVFYKELSEFDFIRIEVFRNTGIVLINCYLDNFANTCCSIKKLYIHELQHLLRICKIDFDWQL